MRRLFHRDAPDPRSSLGSRLPLHVILFPRITETRVSNPYVRMARAFLGRDFVRTRLCIFLHLTRRPAYLSSRLNQTSPSRTLELLKIKSEFSINFEFPRNDMPVSHTRIMYVVFILIAFSLFSQRYRCFGDVYVVEYHNMLVYERCFRISLWCNNQAAIFINFSRTLFYSKMCNIFKIL